MASVCHSFGRNVRCFVHHIRKSNQRLAEAGAWACRSFGRNALCFALRTRISRLSFQQRLHLLRPLLPLWRLSVGAEGVEVIAAAVVIVGIAVLEVVAETGADLPSAVDIR